MKAIAFILTMGLLPGLTQAEGIATHQSSDANVDSTAIQLVTNTHDASSASDKPRKAADKAEKSSPGEADSPRRTMLRERLERLPAPGTGPGLAPGLGDSDTLSPESKPIAPEDLTPEKIEAVLEILREQNPELASRLSNALENQPDVARRIMASHWPRIQRLIDLKKKNPVMFRLTIDEFRTQREINNTARRLRQIEPTDPDRAVLSNELRGHVEKLEHLRMELKKREIEMLEKRLDELRTHLERAQAEQPRRIEQQLEQLLNSKRPAPPPPPPQNQQ